MQSTFKWRRNAVGWWLSKAGNARFSALALSKSHDQTIAAVAEEYSYSGTASVALHEGFMREASVALELIIKAILARKLEIQNADPAKVGVPATHDIPALWKQAGLPELQKEDEYRLLLCKTELIWAGRYPTPKSEAAWQEENKAFEKLSGPEERKGKLIFKKPIGLSPEDFDRLYQMAAAKLSTFM